MQVSDIVSAILVGLVVGTLGRAILPGRQNIGNVATLAIGIISALLGGWVASLTHVGSQHPAHFVGIRWDWVAFGIQVAFAVVATAGAAMLSHSRISTDAPRRRARARRR